MKALNRRDLFLFAACAVVFLAGARGVFAEPPDFREFRILLERNIFDPERRPPRAESRPTTRTVEPVRASVPTERLSLMGVWIEGGEAIAFFEGDREERVRQLRVGDTTGDYKIAAIRTDQIVLVKENLRLEVPVGANLVRERGGDWRIAEETPPRAREESSGSDRRTGSGGRTTGSSDRVSRRDSGGTSPAQPSGGGNAMDILRKMMERRKQEAE